MPPALENFPAKRVVLLDTQGNEAGRASEEALRSVERFNFLERLDRGL
jgi:hypothetical protein